VPAAEAVARTFAANHLPLVEAALRQSLADLDPALGPIRSAARAASGIGRPGASRWRPLLTMAGARAAGVDPCLTLDVAVAVELTHTASLVLDDLPCMDDGVVRRGSPATHRVIGSGCAILVALGLLGRAAELLARAPHEAPALCRSWGRAIGLAGMSGGQCIDLGLSGHGPGELHGAARRLHRHKTTALAAFALGAGARAGGAAPAVVDALERFGRDLGWAYQLADDATDDLEDRRLGRGTAPERRQRAGARLVARAERGLLAASGLTSEGQALLLAFSRLLVPAPAEHDLAC
jgi:geranylgeranyl diphosphate synthase type II